MQADKLKLKLDAEAILRSRSLTDLALARLWRDRLVDDGNRRAAVS